MAEKSVENSVMQGKNGGTLKVGNPGNKGGTGRPPSVVRELSREGFADMIPDLVAIAKGEDVSTADKLRAIDILGKYGGISQVDVVSDGEKIATDSALAALTVEELRAIANGSIPTSEA